MQQDMNPEWIHSYLEYDKLKAMIDDFGVKIKPYLLSLVQYWIPVKVHLCL